MTPPRRRVLAATLRFTDDGPVWVCDLDCPFPHQRIVPARLASVERKRCERRLTMLHLPPKRLDCYLCPEKP